MRRIIILRNRASSSSSIVNTHARPGRVVSLLSSYIHVCRFQLSPHTIEPRDDPNEWSARGLIGRPTTRWRCVCPCCHADIMLSEVHAFFFLCTYIICALRASLWSVLPPLCSQTNYLNPMTLIYDIYSTQTQLYRVSGACIRTFHILSSLALTRIIVCRSHYSRYQSIYECD